MSALARFESFMENMVEGSVARLFRSPVQPAEIAKRLERAMESQQTISVRRVIVPNVYRAFLNPQDLAAFNPIRAEMEREMATYLGDLAQERGFTMLEHPRVELTSDSGVAHHSIQVVAETVASGPADAEHTQVFQPPSQPAAQSRTRLLLATSGGTHVIPLESTQITIGRGLNNDVILEDTRVSRHHAQLRYRARRFWVADLGSTNGTYVNGEQVEEARLNDGDKVMLGQLQVKVRCAAGDAVVVDESSVEIGEVLQRRVSGGEHTTASVDADRLLTLWSEISRTLVATQPIDEVLQRVVDLAFDSMQANRAMLLMYDDSTRLLTPRVVRHRSHKGGSTHISRTMLDQVMRDRVAILAVNAQLDPRLDRSASIRALGIHSFMCAPLWHEEEIIGVLYVDNPLSERFTPADLDLFTAFSNYAAVAIAQARLSARVLDETRRRERLERYHSPAVVDRILKGESDADAPFVAHERDLTVLFADLVGFTTLAESLPPQQVGVLLNAFFARMADVIFQHDGTLDKFIGDSVLAIFGAPMDLPNHALNAVRAGQAMRRALAALNEERPESTLRMRVAIHTGVALVGDIGSPKRREYSVLGDVVNTAARIEESVAGAGQVVISKATFDRLGGQAPANSLGRVQLRGRSQPVDVYEVLDR